ncbi:Peroxisomal catalase, partial [Globisporangium splendens]
MATSSDQAKVITTTSHGAPIPVNGLTAAITAGEHGPIVLHECIILDTLASFDRERIPERVVHAKGAGAFGYFEVTHPEITKYCKTKMFAHVGKRTPLAMRFSTVSGESGSADTVRDLRGFALKFYTEEGNWDLVGNNSPIFFLRDPSLFPSFVHTQKRHPSTHCKDDNMMWDFYSLRPETTHQVTHLYSDRGIPNGYRFMNGYGSHAFTNVNAQGEAVYVKYHFKTDQGIRNLSAEEAEKLTASDPDYATRDLYEAIAEGEYPTWTMYIQVMTYAQAQQEAATSFNPFDVTKVWSQAAYPLIEVGRVVLNRNPKNYFAEIEQLAFAPGRLVPGVEISPDKMLQGRLFSYPDAQRHRIGPNFQQIPVNRPLTPPQTYQRDGAMAVTGNMGSAPNYFPNSVAGSSVECTQTVFHTYTGDHTLVNKFCSKDDDNFTQAAAFYNNVLDDAGRDRLASNIAATLAKASKPVRIRAIANFFKVDADYGARVWEKVDAIVDEEAPEKKMKANGPAAELNPPRKPFSAVPPSDDLNPLSRHFAAFGI